MLKTYYACTDELENDRLFCALYQRMPLERREKTDRMRFPKDKRLSLGAGALLDFALRVEGVTDREFSYEKNRKPCLKNSNLRFNLSHSGNMVFCAVADTDVGCDVEKVTEIDLKIAARFFFKEEYAALLACPDPAKRKDLFFRYWTLKESFMKVTGLGFMLNLDDFCILLGDDDIRVRQSVDERAYSFREYNLAPGYRFAACVAGKMPASQEVSRVRFANLW